MNNNLLLTGGRVEISATGKTPTVNILAYSGGLMHVPGWGHMVIDLSGLDLSSTQIGILSDHDATLKGIVGHGQAEVRIGILLVAGSIAEALYKYAVDTFGKVTSRPHWALRLVVRASV